MTINLTLTGPATPEVRAAAAELLETLSGQSPTERPSPGSGEERRDIGLGIAIVGVVLAVPGAVLATLDVRDRLRKRRELAPKVEAVKRVLVETRADGTIRFEETVISLTGLDTDQILDRLLSDRRK